MRTMGHKVARVLLVMLLSISLSQAILGQSHVDGSPRNSVGSTTPQQSQAEEKSLTSISSFVQEEPLEMMVYGLVLFAIATTFRRMKSRSRVQMKAEDTKA